LLTGRHFVGRQQLQYAQASGCQPAGYVGNVANLADAPSGGRRAGEQGNRKTRSAGRSSRRGVGHGLVGELQSKCRNSRSTPSWNVAGGRSRLTTRNASRVKSKK